MGFMDMLMIWDRPQNASIQKRSILFNYMKVASLKSIVKGTIKRFFEIRKLHGFGA
jgi:hypothetical protein